jgi:phenylacetic acid degradation operon negative regulatory protein
MATKLTPKSLILELLSVSNREDLSVRYFISAGSVFRMGAGSIRVALARLVSRGLLVSNRRGRYSLTSEGVVVRDEVAKWSSMEERGAPWRGGWVGVHTGGCSPGDRKAQRAGVRALELRGFRELQSGLWLRPDNLQGGCERLDRELREIGLDAGAIVLPIESLDAATDSRARALWNTEDLHRSYRETIAKLDESAARLARLPIEEAMEETVLLGREAIHQIVFDPMLPEPLTDGRERAKLVERMRRYDRDGRRYWDAFAEDRFRATLPVGELEGAPA